MLSTSRKLTGYEKIYVTSNERCQFAVEVSNSGLIPKIIRNLTTGVLGFYLKLEGDILSYHNRPVEIHSIPKHVKTCREACKFADSLNFDYQDTFGMIAADDHKVVINVSHLICDGGFFIDFFNRLLRDEPPHLISKLPLTTDDIFSKELSKVTESEIEKHRQSVNFLTSLRWSPNYKELRAKSNENTKCKYIAVETPANEFQFLRNKINLTDLYMISTTLSYMAMNNELQTTFGNSLCVDYRQYMNKSDITPSNTQNTTEINVIADNIKPSTTVRELGRKLRHDLLVKKDYHNVFASYKSLLSGGYIFQPGHTSWSELSNIGRFKLSETNYNYSNGKSLITDMWVQQTMRTSFAEGVVGILAYSKDKHGENTLVTRFQQPCSVLNDQDADIVMKSILHLCKEIPIDITIQEAYDEISRFQNKLRKDHC